MFVPKNRKKIIYNQYGADLQEIIRTLYKYRGAEIHDARPCAPIVKYTTSA
ncbi:MAG: hypothetical protein J6B24_13905 [Clostridia bacterium]|nr:hypothetical protein [Clostridia bacterium]